MSEDTGLRIFKTKEYDQFKFIKQNRRINQCNYAKLVNSMQEEQLIIPVLVNENMEIIDGQHRYEASKTLGLPVYYYQIKGYNIENVKRANMVGCNWSIEDFLEMQLASEIPEYVEFNDLIDKYKIGVTDLLKIFAIVQGKNLKLLCKNFEEGNLNIEGAEKVIEFLNAWDDFSFFKFYRSRSFVGAFIRLYFHRDYDHQSMLDRLTNRKNVFQHQSTIDDYLYMLTKEVYSFGAIKNKIYYDRETRKFYS